MSILIAGFSSFPGAPHNPCEDLARCFAATGEEPARAAGAGLSSIVMPVEWEGSWPCLRDAIAERQPKTVLLFGLHARAERLRVELYARNRRELGRADAVGGFPSGPAILDGPSILASRLDWSAVAAHLRESGTPFEWSTDAGGYLCNDTLYRLAFHAEALGVERFGFFHVPMSDERVAGFVEGDTVPEVFCSLPAAQLRKAALALAECCRTAR